MTDADAATASGSPPDDWLRLVVVLVSCANGLMLLRGCDRDATVRLLETENRELRAQLERPPSGPRTP